MFYIGERKILTKFPVRSMIWSMKEWKEEKNKTNWTIFFYPKKVAFLTFLSIRYKSNILVCWIFYEFYLYCNFDQNWNLPKNSPSFSLSCSFSFVFKVGPIIFEEISECHVFRLIRLEIKMSERSLLFLLFLSAKGTSTRGFQFLYPRRDKEYEKCMYVCFLCHIVVLFPSHYQMTKWFVVKIKFRRNSCTVALFFLVFAFQFRSSPVYKVCVKRFEIRLGFEVIETCWRSYGRKSRKTIFVVIKCTNRSFSVASGIFSFFSVKGWPERWSVSWNSHNDIEKREKKGMGLRKYCRPLLYSKPL